MDFSEAFRINVLYVCQLRYPMSLHIYACRAMRESHWLWSLMMGRGNAAATRKGEFVSATRVLIKALFMPVEKSFLFVYSTRVQTVHSVIPWLRYIEDLSRVVSKRLAIMLFDYFQKAELGKYCSQKHFSITSPILVMKIWAEYSEVAFSNSLLAQLCL